MFLTFLPTVNASSEHGPRPLSLYRLAEMSTGWMDKAMDDPMDEQRAGRQDRASTQEVGVLSEFEMVCTR